ncbi:DNA cytosine methyltransferase [Sphingomonas sp. 2R-10]|uniref:DNA cytosine methyltransferase n=1 Tax=Sphingomonas sp. 2R-10 TaxID=3045148 RepID=UPI000F76B947|nr:DNA cytosine methyltransferase [Sphingomonas sp. 2R-10]MDJ0278539.1 DNA cytosine methyltransferase [Sphingomonas sp. 2R-10]
MTEAISLAVNAPVVDLFCAAGGLSHSFKAEAFKLVASIDIDEVCGSASEPDQHVREGRAPRLEEAELDGTAAAAVDLVGVTAGESAS